MENPTAQYIAELVHEMEAIAAREKIEPLRELLRQAKEEALRVAGASNPRAAAHR